MHKRKKHLKKLNSIFLNFLYPLVCELTGHRAQLELISAVIGEITKFHF